MLVVSRHTEQLSLLSQQCIVVTVEDSVVSTEMSVLESQEEDVPNRILFFKPMSWMGQIRTHRRDEVWSASLWQTFFVMTMGTQIPVIDEKPLVTCGVRKFQLDSMGYHLCPCTAHSGAKKSHDWVVDQFADLLQIPETWWITNRTGHQKRNWSASSGNSPAETLASPCASKKNRRTKLSETIDVTWSFHDDPICESCGFLIFTF
jgi:hypothetical protein